MKLSDAWQENGGSFKDTGVHQTQEEILLFSIQIALLFPVQAVYNLWETDVSRTGIKSRALKTNLAEVSSSSAPHTSPDK